MKLCVLTTFKILVRSNVDKNVAYPPALDKLKSDEHLPKSTELRQVNYLNNLVEQDHKFIIKRLVKPGMEFGLLNTARRTIRGFEAMNMMFKGLRRAIVRRK